MNEDRRPDRDTDPPGRTNPLGTHRASITPTVDDVFEILADERRREICLYFLRTEEAVVTVDDLVDSLAPEYDETERETLAIDLHHRHLPKLDDAGLIEYDPRSHTARYWGQPTVEKWAEHVSMVDARPDGVESE